MGSPCAAAVSSSPLVNLCSKLPRKGRERGVVIVVTELNAVGCSLICPGLGSSNSSTSPSAFCSSRSPGTTLPEPMRANGDGGGLHDFDRRASSCKNGIGENRGVVGVAEGVGCMEIIGRGSEVPVFCSGGKASQNDVTSNDFSTARRYFPTVW